MDNQTLVIIGSIISILLAVNGYYFKEMSKNLFEVRVRLEVWISKHEGIEVIAKQNAADVINIRERLHKLEGGHLQLMQFIEDYNKE